MSRVGEGAIVKHLSALFVVLAVVQVVTLSDAVARTWTSSNGRFQVEAELVDFKDGKVRLKKQDDSVVDVPLALLGAKDREYVRRQYPGATEDEPRLDAEYRKWKSRDGKFNETAALVDSADGTVQLRRSDGSELDIEKKRLSAADQRWVDNEMRRRRKGDKESNSESASEKDSQEAEGQVGDQKITMKLVWLNAAKGKGRGQGVVPGDAILRLVSPQRVVASVSKNKAGDREFQQSVKSEPQYSMATPFRGVARLGDRKYCFALDATDARAAGYNRLYFDVDGDGDLAHVKPIAAKNLETRGSDFSQTEFPSVDITLNVDGNRVEYAFFMTALWHKSANDAFTCVSLYPAVAREGTLTEGAKRTRLWLIDRNSNGRFNDATSIRTSGELIEGDVFLVHPNVRKMISSNMTAGFDRQYVGRTACFGRNVCQTEVSPAGDLVAITPKEVEYGEVRNAAANFRAVLFSEDYGVFWIGGARGRKISVPVGDWKVFRYMLDGGSGTVVAATFDNKTSMVTVRKSETSPLVLGAPFQAQVHATRAGTNKVYLALTVVGVGGERCTNIRVNGKRPLRPRFVIKDENGKAVQRGLFEYG